MWRKEDGIRRLLLKSLIPKRIQYRDWETKL